MKHLVFALLLFSFFLLGCYSKPARSDIKAHVVDLIIRKDSNIVAISNLSLVHQEGNVWSGMFTGKNAYNDSIEFVYKVLCDGEEIQVQWVGKDSPRAFSW